MVKKIILSARQDHITIKKLIKKLRESQNIELALHDPTKDFFTLSRMPKKFREADLIVVKVRNDCSLDLLHYAKLYDLPTLHDIDTVLLCKNKIALDYALRKIKKSHKTELKKFLLPKSWNQSLSHIDNFKKWALTKLPIVIKSHYQHDKYHRFNFLVQKIEDISIFCERYKHFLTYDVYVQKFIECDGIERKIYVIGDKVFGVKRENPIYIYLRDKPENIDVSLIEREEFEINDDILNLSRILSEELNLKIFGFDLVKPIEQNKYYLLDVNDFPSFKGIPNAELELKVLIEEHVFGH